MKIDDEGHRHGQKLIFDTNRTTVTGFSIYPDDTDTAYYFNFGSKLMLHKPTQFLMMFVASLDTFQRFITLSTMPLFEIVMMESFKRGLQTPSWPCLG